MKLAAALLALTAFLAGPSQASVVINAVETGGGTVEFSYSGSLNTSSLTFLGTVTFPLTILSGESGGFLAMDSPVNYYPGNRLPDFGNGGLQYGIMTGQSFAIFDNNYIGIFQDYVSGALFEGKAIFSGTFASLGLFQGTFSTRLENEETITLNISAVPVPAAGFMLASALGLLALGSRRKGA